MADPQKVTIRVVQPVPSRDSEPLKNFKTLYRHADTNQDGTLTSEELGQFQNDRVRNMVRALAIVKDREKEYFETFGDTDEASNILVANWQALASKQVAGQAAGIPMKTLEDLAKKDGDAEDISVYDLGVRKYFDDKRKYIPEMDKKFDPKDKPKTTSASDKKD